MYVLVYPLNGNFDFVRLNDCTGGLEAATGQSQHCSAVQGVGGGWGGL